MTPRSGRAARRLGRAFGRLLVGAALVGWGLGGAGLVGASAHAQASAAAAPTAQGPNAPGPMAPGPIAQTAIGPIRLRDDRGALVELAASPQRIVSLLPSLTESVCALGGCARLVGVDRFSNWPASVRRLPQLGGLEDAQLERVVALKPDLVLVAPSARVIDRLEALGLKVLVLESRDRADVRRTLGTLAQALGTPQQAAAVWARIEQEERVAVQRVPAAWRGRRVYFEVDSALYAAGAASFIGETLAHLGLGNIVPPELGPFPKLNPEFVVRAQPDLVIAQQANLAEMPRRPGWAGLRALRDGATCGFGPADYELLIRPGPRMGEAAQSLAACLAALPVRAAASGAAR